MRAALVAFACLGMGCKKDAPVDASPPAPSASTSVPTAVKSQVMVPAKAPSSSPVGSVFATKGRCRARTAEEPKPVRGAGVFVTRDGKNRVAVNDDGVPKFIDSVTEPLKASLSPCATAGDALYCASKKGIIRRYDLRGTVVDVAEGAKSSRIAAAKVGDHEVVAFLRAAPSASGTIREAWARTSKGELVKVSDDGSGATAASIVTSDDRIYFLTAEARTSLATITVRNAIFKDGQLSLAPATVIFAGGGGDYLLEPQGTLSREGRLILAATLPQDLHAFGAAAFVLDANRLTNVEPAWSLYPRALDEAPFAMASHQGKTWMVRVRPTSEQRNSALVLEVGQLDEAGRFVTFGERMAPENPTHLAMTSDREALGIYVDGERGGQRERWSCGEGR